MIANKHTEMRIFDNLNSLLRASLDEKEYKERISRHIRNYIVDYVDEHSYEQGIYDIFEELGNSYQKHCWNIAKRIKDEILKEKKETNWLNPDVYTKEFEETMKEELTNKVLPHYFKELDNQLSIYEYKNKIKKLKKKSSKDIVEDNIDDIEYLIKARINKAFEFYLKQADGNAKLVIDNFDMVRDVIDDVFNDVLTSIHNGVDDSIKKKDIEKLFEKHLKAFIKEQRGILKAATPKVEEEQKTSVQVGVGIPSSFKAYLLSSIWKDITK